MKRIINLFLIVILLMILTSCKAKEVDSTSFIDYASAISSGTKVGKIVDLRPLEKYGEYHIYSSLSYDLTKQEKENIATWLKGFLREKKMVLLIDDGDELVKEVIAYLKDFKVYYYSSGFDELRKNNYYQEQIIEATGTDDCGC